MHSLGYTEEKKRGEHHWKRAIEKKNEFPRFHIIVNGDEVNLHYDKSRHHGSFMKWVGRIVKNNVIQSGNLIMSEAKHIKVETMYQESVRLVKEINERIKKLEELRKRIVL